MASVFLSYDHDDAKRARPIALQLEKAGHSVWWDLHVRGGAQFSKVIEEALKSADVVVVLWSKESVESPWVRDEAAAGRDTGRLVPATIDGTEPPMGFRQFQTIDLARKGRGAPAQLRTLLADVASIADASSRVPAPEPRRSNRKLPLPIDRRIVMLAIAAVLAIVAAGAVYRLLAPRRGGTPSVAVIAADNSLASRNMARDLLIDLGNLQPAKSGSMTLLNGAGKSSAPDLSFQASDTSGSGSRSATLALLDGSTGGLLWSMDFQQPSGTASDLKDQLAVTAARVLGCALDGMSDERPRLAAQVLKTYLNACAQRAGISGDDDLHAVIAMFEQVTRASPHFAPAWGKLLLTKAGANGLSADFGVPDDRGRGDFRQLIAQARELNPGLPEADLAESTLLPPTAYREQLALINRAAGHSPDNPDVLNFRAWALLRVGKMLNATQDAARASELDPLSPALRGDFVVALAFSGLIDSAHGQLDELVRLWPGTTTAHRLKYFFNFRYGDPKIALAMPETQSGTAGVRDLLQARLDPTRANVDQLVQFLRARKNKFQESAGADRLSYYTLAMGQFHQHDELFDTLTHWRKPEDLALIADSYFRPELREFRKEPRFLQIMQRAGLLDYWRKSGGWPDFCFEADMPYDCKKEAAKLKA